MFVLCLKVGSWNIKCKKVKEEQELELRVIEEIPKSSFFFLPKDAPSSSKIQTKGSFFLKKKINLGEFELRGM